MTDAPSARNGPRVRSDVRLDDEPMRDLTCDRCGAVVTARKSSWDQTSLQWTRAALARCEERRDHGERAMTAAGREAFRGCAALKQSVRAAAVRGELPVHDTAPLRTNPDEEGRG